MFFLNRASRAMLLCVLVIAAAFGSAHAGPEESFVVRDIRIEGLQRISEGTLLNYLPVNVGDRLDEQRIRSAIRAVYRAGFFRDVRFYRTGSTLIVEVEERPSIASFDISGNKDIETENLLDSLREMGLAEGRVFNRSTLEMVRQELVRQYHSRGKYGVQIGTRVEELPNNLVNVSINVTEGSASSIREINVVNNSAFPDEDLVGIMELQPTNWTSWLTGDDAYSRQKLTGDLEALRSYYMDRGYADFEIESTQVTISPTLEDMFLTLGIREGDVYKVGEIKFAGNLIIEEERLRQLVLLQPGDTFSLARATATAEYMKSLYGSRGFGFAEVNPYPDVNRESGTVDIVFAVQPGRRTYVNEIRFMGASGTQDEVFRREMRQFEGAWYVNNLVERSKTRIERLPFVERVEYETIPVPGEPDKIDIEYEIKQRQAGTFNFSIGYGSGIGAILNTGITHSNVMGTGDYLALNLARTSFNQNYSITHRDPYATIDGVSRNLSAFYSKSDSLVRDASALNITQYGGRVSYDFPITEYMAVSLGVNAQHNELITNALTSSEELIEFVNNNGSPFTTPFGDATEYDTFELIAGWGYDSRNRTIFADRGAQSQISLSVTTPFSDVEYYTFRYKQLKYVPMPLDLTLGFNGEVALGEPLGATTDYPPTRNFYAGGPDTVRGFRDNFLGPLDSRGRPLGGAFRTYLQTELILPRPGEGAGAGNYRFGFFYDIGNVYSSVSEFEAADLRSSAGVSAVWLTPLGVMRFSIGVPLRDKPGDLTERFQFSVGTVF